MGEVALGGSPTVKRVIDRLVEELHDRHEATYDMMRRLDRNGDGRLDRDELRTPSGVAWSTVGGRGRGLGRLECGGMQGAGCVGWACC